MRLLALLLFPVTAGCAAGISPSGLTDARSFAIDREGVVLAATLIEPTAPDGTGVVLLPGSGPATREMMKPTAEKFATLGTTVVYFDKRGSGESGGDWTASSLDDLAGDASEAIRILREAGARRIGFWGHSQGVWVAQRAIELGAAPDFLIAVSGGGASPREVESYAYRRNIARFSKDDQAAALALVDDYFNYLGGKLPREVVASKIKAAKEAPWFSALGLSPLVATDIRGKWSWVADYDPSNAGAGEGLRTLVLLGAEDGDLPLDLTIGDWTEQIGSSGRIVVFGGREHHLLKIEDASHGHFAGMSTDEEIWEIIDAWLR